LVTSEFLHYYHCLFVYAVQLTVLGIRWYIYELLQLLVDLNISATQWTLVFLGC